MFEKPLSIKNIERELLQARKYPQLILATLLDAGSGGGADLKRSLPSVEGTIGIEQMQVSMLRDFVNRFVHVESYRFSKKEYNAFQVHSCWNSLMKRYNAQVYSIFIRPEGHQESPFFIVGFKNLSSANLFKQEFHGYPNLPK